MGSMEIQERTDTLVSLTPAAAAKIKQLIESETDVSVLRVAIEGGGCSGFQYGLGFDRGAVEGDHEYESEGVRVVVDPFSAPYLRGDLLERPRDGLDLRMVGRDAEADEPPRRRQPLDHVNLDADVGSQQRTGRVEAGRPRADNRNA